MSGRGIVEAEIFRSELIEANARTSDPTNPAVGDFWIRSDVQPSVSGATTVAALRIQGPGGVLEVPLFDSSEASNLGADVYVGERRRFDDGTVGFIAETDQGGSLGSPRLLAPDGTEYEAHDDLEVSAIPDSALVQNYDAKSLTATDGDTIDPFPDEQNNVNVPVVAGDPVYETTTNIGEPAVRTDGSEAFNSDSVAASGTDFTIGFVIEPLATSDERFVHIGTGSHNAYVRANSGTWEAIVAGDSINSGGSVLTGVTYVGVLATDGSNIVLDIGDTEVVAASVNKTARTGTNISQSDTGSGRANANHHQHLVYDEFKTNSERNDIIDSLESRWGFTSASP